MLWMIGDVGPGERWLLWATPFGWTELVRPYTENDPWPLVVSALAILVLAAAATTLAARCDVGSGLLPARESASPRSLLLSSAGAMSVRLELPTLVAWCAAAATAGVVFGVFAQVTTADVPDSLRDSLDRFSVQRSFISQFLGVVFLLIATVVALGLGALLGAGLNVVPTALVALGVGARTLSIAGRFAAAAVYTLVTWSVFASLLAPLVTRLDWADRLSLFHRAGSAADAACAPTWRPCPVGAAAARPGRAATA